MAHIGSGIDDDERYEAAIEILKKGGAVDLGIVSPYPDEAVNIRIGYTAATEKFMSMDVGLEKRLGNCSFLLKGGEAIIKEGKLNRASAKKKTFYFVPEVKEKAYKSELIERICNRRSFRAEHLKVDECFFW